MFSFDDLKVVFRRENEFCQEAQATVILIILALYQEPDAIGCALMIDLMLSAAMEFRYAIT
ncbi:hypothetical protein NTGBS_40002 [Candidatus Nitrotoga sp. BS]|nr:hypothetical protein NTGBS_40002 [Candidatus Nitrotoga sp. BS]